MSELVLVTGAAGLVGSATVRHFAGLGYTCIGVDNDMRRRFFGDEASTAWSRESLEREVPRYRHHDLDIRDFASLERIFRDVADGIALVVHAAAQPSHDWAAREPLTDFAINATGTLNLLELTRRHCPSAVFIFTSTNKVYGDLPNSLPLVERDTRWEVRADHPFAEHGIDESMSIDSSTHSVFGASKVAADVMVQEYGRYFGLRTGAFRGGCLTGPDHSGAQLHGFLAYLVKCAVTGTSYTIFGHKGKQVRDNIHADDLVVAFEHFFREPRPGAVYNIGGSRYSCCSMLEAIDYCECKTGRRMNVSYQEVARLGDHAWYVSDVRRFQADYPDWTFSYDGDRILDELLDRIGSRHG